MQGFQDPFATHSSLGVKYVCMNDAQAGQCHLRVEKQLMLRWPEAAILMSISLWLPAQHSPVQIHISTSSVLQRIPLPCICKLTVPWSIPVPPCFM